MKLPKKVDCIVVGAGLVGLSLLKKIEASGASVVLLEKSDSLDGSFLDPNFLENQNINTVAWSNESEIPYFEYKASSQSFTLGKKGLVPFVGFGEEKVNGLDIADSFSNASTKLVAKLKPEFTQKISHEKIFTHSQITAIYKSQPESNNYDVFEINGKTQVQASAVFWTPPIQDLERVLPKDDFTKLRQKIKKANQSDAITAKFNLSSEELKDFADKNFIFIGEEQNLWFGTYLNEELNFISFYSSSLSGDHSFLRKHLKTLKRQLRKAFPDVFSEESLKSFVGEKICLHKSPLSQISLNLNKDAGLKDLPTIKFYGSHKGFSSLEDKLNKLDEDFNLNEKEAEA